MGKVGAERAVRPQKITRQTREKGPGLLDIKIEMVVLIAQKRNTPRDHVFQTNLKKIVAHITRFRPFLAHGVRFKD